MSKSAFFALFAVAIVLASPFDTSNRRTCGTTPSAEKVAAAEAHFKAAKVKATFSAEAASIPIQFHVISRDTTAASGNVPYVVISSYSFIF